MPAVRSHSVGAWHPALATSAAPLVATLRWDDAGAPGVVTITAPPSSPDAPRPVVVLLPALGEDGAGARGWAGVLAGAGYAVICIQPLPDDAQAWKSDRARSGAFATIARERFDPDLLPRRIEALSRTLARVRTRIDAGEAPPKGLRGGLDWNRLSYFGLDLGAYTVQAIAAGMGGALPPALALVAVSPFGPGAGSTADFLPRAPHAPILFASSLADADPYGLIAGPPSRHRAFDALGPGRSGYLELRDATHSILLGDPVAEPVLDLPERPMREMADPQAGQRGGQRGGQKGAQREGAGGRGGREGWGDDEDGESPQQRIDSARKRFEEARQLTAARINARTDLASVVLAHMDAATQDFQPARIWLEHGAAQAWLGESGRIRWVGLSEK
jgi:hypothetical protein